MPGHGRVIAALISSSSLDSVEVVCAKAKSENIKTKTNIRISFFMFSRISRLIASVIIKFHIDPEIFRFQCGHYVLQRVAILA